MMYFSPEGKFSSRYSEVSSQVTEYGEGWKRKKTLPLETIVTVQESSGLKKIVSFLLSLITSCRGWMSFIDLCMRVFSIGNG